MTRIYYNFGYKPPNAARIFKQARRVNQKQGGRLWSDRESVMQFMTPDKLEVLSHEIVDSKGITRRPITGLAQINQTKGLMFPAAHVSYVTSLPVRSPYARSSATDDLGTNLMNRLGQDGMFDLDPVNNAVAKLYRDKLGTDLYNMGSYRSIKEAKKKQGR